MTPLSMIKGAAIAVAAFAATGSIAHRAAHHHRHAADATDSKTDALNRQQLSVANGGAPASGNAMMPPVPMAPPAPTDSMAPATPPMPPQPPQ